jgi:hypothetical protein
VIFGPVYDPLTPAWKKLAFAALILAAAFIVYRGRSRSSGQFLTAVLLAVVASLAFVLILFFR